MDWNAIAPSQSAITTQTDPGDPGYDWTRLDELVQSAVGDDLQPILDVSDTPGWAEAPGSSGGVWHPQLQALASFAHAVAERYGGAFDGLPRVRHWMLWTEPNLNTNLQPQFRGTTPVSPGIYRGMVNAFAAAVKRVHPGNFVIAGALAPYGIEHKGQPLNNVLSVAPMTFMRSLLCVSAGAAPRSTCSTKIMFDAFSVHPYTWGGPTHKAYSPNDVAIGDLPNVQALLRTAWRLGRISAASQPPLWVTEFSWDTNPPDPKAVPIAIQARWTSEALFHMWQDGVGLVTWFLLRDEPWPSQPFQSGLYFAGSTVAADRPKPTLTAFRFPFVAEFDGNGYDLWGRTPSSNPGRVAIEQRGAHGWQRVALLQANRFGIFQGRLVTAARSGYVRARILGSADISLPFGLKPVPDRRVNPFGT